MNKAAIQWFESQYLVPKEVPLLWTHEKILELVHKAMVEGHKQALNTLPPDIQQIHNVRKTA